MSVIVASPSTAPPVQQVALAFYERDALECLLTTFAFLEDGPLARLLARLPGNTALRLKREFARRAISTVPTHVVETRPLWEMVRTLAHRAGASAPLVDRIWDHLSHNYTFAAARRLRQGSHAIYAYEYTALEAFEEAAERGLPRILDFPSPNSRQYERLKMEERALHPGLAGRHDAYFDKKFEVRQARRDAEMTSADVIITNSTISRDSHIEGGADPQRIFSVPHGAPPVTDRAVEQHRAKGDRLKVVWAGTFSFQKGAHYLLQAWPSVRSAGVEAAIYGSVVLPEKLLAPGFEDITFHGAVTRPVLFDAFDRSDVLVFPTLRDGFGMVVTEAFARGLPVITTDQAGASELVEHEHNGLVIPAGDSQAIADALTWCLDNRAKLVEMRHAALDTARRWQWSDYRRALVNAVETGLHRAGYTGGLGRAPATS